jgi:hypothetical protein
VTSATDTPALPFSLWAQTWARFLNFCGLAAFVGVEGEILANEGGFGVLFTVVAMLLFLPFVWWFARGLFVHVRVASEGVRVVNGLRTYDLRWDEIEAIEAVNQVGGIGSYARIIKTDGEPLTLGVSNYGIRGDPTAALRIATPLGQALDRQRARSSIVP